LIDDKEETLLLEITILFGSQKPYQKSEPTQQQFSEDLVMLVVKGNETIYVVAQAHGCKGSLCINT
jgi:hypothetical protein